MNKILVLSIFILLSNVLGSKPSLLMILSDILAQQWLVGRDPLIPLGRLFINAVLDAEQLHRLATDTFKEFDKELLLFSLAFIRLWLKPVQFLSQEFGSLETSDLEKLHEQVFEKLEDLEEGIQVLMKKLQDESSSDLKLLVPTYDKFDVDLQDEGSLMKIYGLLFCMKKDLHKVSTYLRVVKFRNVEEIDDTT
ncbi:hypothetical protein lerEdw1_004445 [Lerista edwardsae]|nr:hypothetical protein lerEdw1_004445 [Lerista edwardsae]